MGAVLLDSCGVEGRDGMREEAALCGHILFDEGRFHKPPNSCYRLHVFDCLLGLQDKDFKCHISQRGLFHTCSCAVVCSVQ